MVKHTDTIERDILDTLSLVLHIIGYLVGASPMCTFIISFTPMHGFHLLFCIFVESLKFEFIVAQHHELRAENECSNVHKSAEAETGKAAHTQWRRERER